MRFNIQAKKSNWRWLIWECFLWLFRFQIYRQFLHWFDELWKISVCFNLFSKLSCFSMNLKQSFN
jgi:hypothetical protein